MANDGLEVVSQESGSAGSGGDRGLLEHRPLSELGQVHLGWLDSRHHFAIGPYGNPYHRPVGNLISWADDEIAPGTGFGLHPHANVEIITYVRQGAITHRDSLGNEGRTLAGDVQVMSAGSGIRHSESNEEASPTKIFQIWLKPRETGGEPRWGNRPFPQSAPTGRFVTLASGFGTEDGALSIRSDARVLGVTLERGQSLSFSVATGRKAYLVPAKGDVAVNGQLISESEGLAVWSPETIEIEALCDSEIVLVETV
jgi:redox-sensitive bicupin YhaK (pirin superfamily)